jgi:hypothetical protein
MLFLEQLSFLALVGVPNNRLFLAPVVRGVPPVFAIVGVLRNAFAAVLHPTNTADQEANREEHQQRRRTHLSIAA